jgi:hypothetical protein
MSELSNSTPHPQGQRRHSFYQLTTEEWIHAVHTLTESQKDVLYYIKTLNPFGDRDLDLGVREIARTLKYDPGTISRALKALDSKGYIDLEMLHVRVRITCKQVLHQNNTVAPEQHLRSQRNTNGAETTLIAPEQHSLHQNNTRRSKRRRSKGSTTPHTLQTDQTDQTLSLPPPAPERELLEFVIRSIKGTEGIKHPRAYALKVLERDRAHWEEAFQKSRQRLDRTTIPPSSPEQKNFDERESLIGLIELKRNAGQPLSAAVLQRAQALGIPLEPKATTPGATNHA